VRSGVETVLNPFDEFAIEAALQLKEKLNDGSTVTIVSMTPESGKEIVRKALAMGADDAVMLSDAAFEGCDTWGTAYALAAGIAKTGFDIVLTGTQSTDAITGELPGALGEFLGVPIVTNAREISVDGGRVRIKRETETGYQVVSGPTPILISVTKSAGEPRYPSLKGIMGAKKKQIAVLSAADLALAKPVGSDGAKTELIDLAAPPVRGKGQSVSPPDAVEAARTIVAFLKEKKLL
jgi:electron transfer flavoprotein beta subunit